MNALSQAITAYSAADDALWTARCNLRTQLEPVVQLTPEWSRHKEIHSAEWGGEVALIELECKHDGEKIAVRIPRAVIEAEDPVAAMRAHREAERQRALAKANEYNLREIESLERRLAELKSKVQP